MVSKTIVTVVCLFSAPWLLLGPLNIFKVSIINKPSPMAKHFVSKDSEICQAGCDIARMWACLFWGLQTVLAAGIYTTSDLWSKSTALRRMFASAKMFVAIGLLVAFSKGITKWVIAIAGVVELVLALLLFFSSSDKPDTKQE
jgi:hypothetical protein